jgi:hypothetical protein
MRSIVTVALLLLAALPAFSQPPAPSIVPGSRIGPVALGMAESEARAAAARFERETDGCTIDIAVAAGRVIAAGTRYGGCLSLELPAETQPLVVQAGTFLLPLPAGIGGPAIALINAFGRPLAVRLGGDEVAFVWPQGLAAHVGAASDHGGVVTYLAVVAPDSTAVPRIGHFVDDAPPAQ